LDFLCELQYDARIHEYYLKSEMLQMWMHQFNSDQINETKREHSQRSRTDGQRNENPVSLPFNIPKHRLVCLQEYHFDKFI